MKTTQLLISILLLCFVCGGAKAQTNYVKNPSFEDTVQCPDEINEIGRAKYWTCAVDTDGSADGSEYYAPEFFHACENVPWRINCGTPVSRIGFQFPHTGLAYAGGTLFYDSTPPPPSGLWPTWRDYAQGHLQKPLIAGKSYCISFWVCMGEVSGYAHDNIGAYLDNGGINLGRVPGEQITDVTPQLRSKVPIKDTQNWIKVEGTFTATGKETHITIGNFAKQADVTPDKVPYFTPLYQYSYYLFDDISVVESDLKADAGKDNWVTLGGTVQIGRVSDTTAEAIDCKWYRKGSLIDSGAIITVKANAVAGKIDTYVVVQSVCGNISTDTVLVKTTPVGITEVSFKNDFSIYPNPSNGTFYISPMQALQTAAVKVFDLLGRKVLEQSADFSSGKFALDLSSRNGMFIVEISDSQTVLFREKVLVE